MNRICDGIYNKFKGYVKRRIVMTQYEWTSWGENAVYTLQKNISRHEIISLLDIGCGNGENAVRVSNSLDIDINNVYGVDFDEVKLITARQIFNVIKLDLERGELPFKEDIFDLVICDQVLEHLKNYRKVIDEAVRVTRKGGYILIDIPNLAHLINRFLLLFGQQPMCIVLDGPHIHGFTHKAFIKLLNSLNGVKLIDSTGTLMYPLPFALAKFLSRFFVGLTGYTCYLLRKNE
ncbi:MAG: hypothetical protein SRB1_02426 [Desulfobacteraceae bacterium Eth-SRB1]|nr:MAG: hypothetical protein SRB1_02426 [Desulfobacteraceae bacterium Eth-SRB1]